VAVDEGRERRLVATLGETGEQLGIGRALGSLTGEDRPQVAKDGARWVVGHWNRSEGQKGDGGGRVACIVVASGLVWSLDFWANWWQ
jgi:hypothetical protein